MPSELANKAILLLSPNVGNAVALSTVTEACKMIKRDIETLDNSQLVPFVDQLEKILGPRVGPAIAKKTRSKILELTGMNKSQEQKSQEIVLNSGIDKEIHEFLQKNTLPTENDITDYAKYLSLTYGGDAKSVEKDLIDKVRFHVRNSISKRKTDEELGMFLTSYPQPTKTDIDDFIGYLHLLKLNVQEEELRNQIETQRLLLKFHGTHEEASPEIGRFMDFVKVSGDKKTVGEAMKKQGLTYLIKDDSGDSDKSLSEFIELIKPSL